MYLFFDTETTGLPKSWKAPVSSLSNWPRMVQLAWLLYDSRGREIAGADRIIRPEGFTIPAAASRIHGITTARARKEGLPLREALEEFRERLEASRFLVAHNIAFDSKILGAEFLRSRMGNLLESKKQICTMQGTTAFCRLPGRYGYKWPTLTELHYKLFRAGFDDAHDAAADIRITAKCFWKLRKLDEL
jgi:DNA polymerase III epsilon subunit-like protein